jgi:multidrug efflux pump subunit AcrA (membrane-fusion protein)
MTSYPDGTLLRISPSSIGNSVAVSLGSSIAVNPSLAEPVESAAEWLAICMTDGIIDRPVQHITYPSVEEWLATIPADITQLLIHPPGLVEAQAQAKAQKEVNRAQAKAQKDAEKAQKDAEKAQAKAQKDAEKAQAKAKKKKVAWNVPKSNSTQKWAYYIHKIIRESGLEGDDVRDAYNRFVGCLLEHNLNIRTSIPWPRDKYEMGIELSPNIDAPRHGIRDYVHLAPRITFERGREILRSIYDAYQPLFLLMKGTVIPYMQKMSKQRKNDYDTALYTRALTKAVAEHQKLIQNYQIQEAYLRNHMEKLQRKLDALKGPEGGPKFDRV